MTTLMREEYTCSVCGHTHEYVVIGSTNCFGYSDLDFRPAEMQRSTMAHWLQECPECGYVSKNVSASTEITREFLEQEDYRTCEGNRFESGLAQRFYRRYMICREEGDVSGEFHSLLHAAWACDDRGETGSARVCREKALQYTDALIRQDPEHEEAIRLIRMDILRRNGQFEELKEEYADTVFQDEDYEKTRTYQLKLAARKDDGQHTFGEVFRN